jgi:hypothetical protein
MAGIIWQESAGRNQQEGVNMAGISRQESAGRNQQDGISWWE